MNVRDEQRIEQRVRLMQLIRGALVMGPLTFLVIALFLRNTNPPQHPAEAPPLVSLISAVLLLTCVPVAFLLPSRLGQQKGQLLPPAGSPVDTPAGAPAVEDQAVADSQTGRWLAVRQTGTIIQGALFEGAAFAGLLAYYLEGYWLGLAVGVAGILLLLGTFPTSGGVRAWLEQQRRGAAGF